MENNIASTGKRMGGGIIDVIIRFALVAIFSFIFGDSSSVSTGNNGIGIHLTGWSFVIGSLLLFVGFAYLEFKFGKTPGKYIAGTKVISENGEVLTFKQTIIRNLLRIIDGFFFYLVGLIIILCDKKNQRLGDMFGKTLVVNA